jgi:opacity protein-like surface antigen
MKRMLVFAVCVTGWLTAGAAPAAAQGMGAFHGYFTGQVGWAAGGDLSSTVFTPGAVVSVQEENGWGAEFDFGYSADADAGPQLLDVATYMFNASWVQPRGNLRPFGSVGAGLMQVDGCDSPCTRPAMTYDLGVNFGGGAFYTLNDAVGLRGDVRYFRTLADHADLNRPSKFGFWRVSLGVTLMWAFLP